MKDKFFAKLFATFLSTATILVPMTTIVSCVQQPQQSQIEEEIDATELEDSFTKRPEKTDEAKVKAAKDKQEEVKQEIASLNFSSSKPETSDDKVKTFDTIKGELTYKQLTEYEKQLKELVETFNKAKKDEFSNYSEKDLNKYKELEYKIAEIINTKDLIITNISDEKTSKSLNTKQVTENKDPILTTEFINKFFNDGNLSRTNLNVNLKNGKGENQKVKIDDFGDYKEDTGYNTFNKAANAILKSKFNKYEKEGSIFSNDKVKVENVDIGVMEISEIPSVLPSENNLNGIGSDSNTNYATIDDLLKVINALKDKEGFNNLFKFTNSVVKAGNYDAKYLLSRLHEIKRMEEIENFDGRDVPAIRFVDSFYNCQSRPLRSTELTHDELNEFSKRSRWREDEDGLPGGMLFYKLKVTNLNDSNRGDVTFENAYGTELEFVGDKTNLTNVPVNSLNVQSVKFNGVVPKKMYGTKTTKIIFENATLPDNIELTRKGYLGFSAKYAFSGASTLIIDGKFDIGNQKKLEYGYPEDIDVYKGTQENLNKLKELGWVKESLQISTQSLLNKVKDEIRE
ncbi:MAG: hypothetical protein ACTTJ6_09245 [Treponema sp.]